MSQIKKLLLIRHPKAEKYPHGESMDLLLQGEVQRLREDPGEYLRETFVIPQGVRPDQAYFRHSERLRTLQACQAIAIGAFGLQYKENPEQTPSHIEVDDLRLVGYQGLAFSRDNGLNYMTPSINSRVHKEQGPRAVLVYEMQNCFSDQHEDWKIDPFVCKVDRAESAARGAIQRLATCDSDRLEVLCSHSCQVEPVALSLYIPDIKQKIKDNGWVDTRALDAIGGAFMERDYAEVTLLIRDDGIVQDAVYERKSRVQGQPDARFNLDIERLMMK